MAKVAIITDQHFGARNDSQIILDYYERFYREVFFPSLEKLGIDTILILGDTFDKRKQININTLSQAKTMFFDKLSNYEVHMIIGNHDAYFKNTNEINSPEFILTGYDNITTYSKPKEINIKGLDILFMSWISDENHDECMAMVEASQSRVCMGHFEFAGFKHFKTQTGTESKGMSTVPFKKFEIVFSGHYHHKHEQGNVHYLGNPYELTLHDEGDPRGFHIFDTDTLALEHYVNPYVLFKVADYDDTKDIPAVDESYKGKIIRITVVNKTDFAKFDDFIRRIQEQEPIDIKIIEDISLVSEAELDETVSIDDTQTIINRHIDGMADVGNKEDLKTMLQKLYVEAVNREDV